MSSSDDDDFVPARKSDDDDDDDDDDLVFTEEDARDLANEAAQLRKQPSVDVGVVQQLVQWYMSTLSLEIDSFVSENVHEFDELSCEHSHESHVVCTASSASDFARGESIS